jgi:hypothetical protein
MTIPKWLRKTPSERFWENVRKGPQCWEWTGNFTNGHGRWQHDGRTQSAHRVAYLLTYGSIPASLHIDHLCKNVLCVRPDHLEAVTHNENMRRQSWSLDRRRQRHAVLNAQRGGTYTESYELTLWTIEEK